MAEYRIVLTDEQETCLLYDIEQSKESLALDEKVLQIVTVHLANIQRAMDATLSIDIGLLKSLDAVVQTSIVEAIPSQAEKYRLTALLRK